MPNANHFYGLDPPYLCGDLKPSGLLPRAQHTFQYQYLIRVSSGSHQDRIRSWYKAKPATLLTPTLFFVLEKFDGSQYQSDSLFHKYCGISFTAFAVSSFNSICNVESMLHP